MRKNTYHYRLSFKGFTLIEVMVVVVILGILAALIVPKIMSRPEQARLVKAQQDILMPDVEEGNVILIGATTLNPFFAIVGPLLSRD